MSIVSNRREPFGHNVGSIFTSRNIVESEGIEEELFSCEMISNVDGLCLRVINKGFCNVNA